MVLLGTAMLTQPILNKTENMMTSTMSTFAAEEEDSLEVSEISLPEVQPVPSSTSNTTSGNTANANAVEMVRDDDWKNKVASHTLKSMPSFYGAEKSGSASGPLQWYEGRGREAVEVSQALEVFINTIKLSPRAASSSPEVCVRFHFIGGLSSMSPAVAVGSANTISVNFASHIRFDDKACHLLSERIRSNRESLALEILLLTINANGGEGLSVQGVASVNLWVMVEDSVSILRQEVDVFSMETAECIGTATVDVRGHHVLAKCAAPV